jgi:PAS domain S-box-containing protein
VLGRILLLRLAHRPAFHEGDAMLLQGLADRATLALENARLYEAERDARIAAEAAEERYRALFTHVGDAILVFDARGRYVDANPAATALLGYTRDEFLGLRVGALSATLEQGLANLATFQEEGVWRGEAEARRRDGSVITVDVQSTSVELPTGLVYVSVLRDISRRRALERLQQEFVALVTHELRNPLTALKGYAQLMQRRHAYSEQATANILAQANLLERILDDLREAARLGAGRLDLQRTAVDLVEVARGSAEQVQMLTQEHTIRLVAARPTLIGHWDRHRLGQVFQNLLTNAVKYSPDGGAIELRLEDEGAVARVAVRDQGIGIPPAEISRLFDRFYRAGSAAATSAKGLGLGLYVSKALVEALGGRIWVESAGEGAGSTFRFTLPYGAPTEAPATHTATFGPTDAQRPP